VAESAAAPGNRDCSVSVQNVFLWIWLNPVSHYLLRFSNIFSPSQSLRATQLSFTVIYRTSSLKGFVPAAFSFKCWSGQQQWRTSPKQGVLHIEFVQFDTCRETNLRAKSELELWELGSHNEKDCSKRHMMMYCMSVWLRRTRACIWLPWLYMFD